MVRIASIGNVWWTSVVIAYGVMAGTALAATPDSLSDRGTSSTASAPAATSAVTAESTLLASRRTRVDFSALTKTLPSKTDEYAVSESSSIRLILPLPEGGETEFTLIDSGAMPPELAQRFPQIRSMKGADAAGRQVRLDMSASGVRAIVFASDGIWQVQPAPASPGAPTSSNVYISARTTVATGMPAVAAEPAGQNGAAMSSMALASPHNSHARRPDNSHRDYRIAIAATSEYSKYFGGTVGASLASVVQVVNRVNAIFERDLGIHLTLVRDNDKIIFTDPATDPYIPLNNDDLDFTRAQNVKILNQLIGSREYDVGQIFEAGIQGGALTGGVCQVEQKGDAGSGLQTRLDAGASFDDRFILLVAHELGHQFGANHVANGCGRDNPQANEPGSGSSLMSYAGGCFVPEGWPPVTNRLHDLQDHRDAYFNAKNIAEVRAFITAAGAACGVRRDNAHTAPAIIYPPRDTTWVIPAHTPFVLSGFAMSRYRRAQLTYGWEQMDAGAEQMTNEALSDKGSGPIFRSYPPGSDGRRIFPALAVTLGEQAISNGEVYPATSRELNFRLTVRDNLGWQSSTSHLDTTVQVIDTGKPFRITYPDQWSTWRARDKQLVSWDVAGTDHAPFSCRRVRIDLSLDGGHTYPGYPLVASAPNNGWAIVSLPRLWQDISAARIRVACNGNVFFAVSPGNFTIRR